MLLLDLCKSEQKIHAWADGKRSSNGPLLCFIAAEKNYSFSMTTDIFASALHREIDNIV